MRHGGEELRRAWQESTGVIATQFLSTASLFGVTSRKPRMPACAFRWCDSVVKRARAEQTCAGIKWATGLPETGSTSGSRHVPWTALYL